MQRKEMEKTLNQIARAWGRTQNGTAFFPWINRQEQKESGSRRAGFHEGRGFQWPDEKAAIVDHMLAHQDDDLYWCPSLFEFKERSENEAMDEHALWADLDECDPRELNEYPPTIAWETSPGRYQALWIAAAGDFQGASWPGNENQRMTYMIGADPSGWDTVQLLRIPGWSNHKPEYETAAGESVPGKLLWSDGPTYLPGDFGNLPEVKGLSGSDLTDALESDIDGVDRLKVIARVKLKLNKRARDLLGARASEVIKGEQGDNLWYLIRCLADVGCSIPEIVAIVRETVWNKFKDRADELRRLIIEASKAIASRSPEAETKLSQEDDERHDAKPQRFGAMLKNVKRPQFLIEGILTVGACGFIAAEPKCFKSWCGLDMAISVATGSNFLGEFRVNEPGPVLYIQEEDPLPTLKTRTAKIWAGKATDKMVLVQDGDFKGVEWLPPDSSQEFDPDVNAVVQEGVTISDEAWMIWMDETLSAGMLRAGDTEPTPYKLILIDTLMMTAGDVEESKAQEMTSRIFRPLKVMSRKHNVAVIVIHHMSKAEKARPGQRMLGSVANHAWSEDALYLSRPPTGKDIRIDTESKTAPAGIYRLRDRTGEKGWEPSILPWHDEPTTEETLTQPRSRTQPTAKGNELINLVKAAGTDGTTTGELSIKLGVSKSTVWRRLARLKDMGKVETFVNGKIDAWRVTTK